MIHNEKSVKQLNQLEHQLAEVDERLERLQSRRDTLFRQVWQIFDMEIGENQRAMFLCDDGYVLGRVVPKDTTTIDPTKFIALVKKHIGGLKGARLLGRVLTYQPHVDQTKLAREIVMGRVPEHVATAAMTTKANTPRRYRDKASPKMKKNIEKGIVTFDDELEWSA